MTQTLNAPTEADILTRVVEPMNAGWPPEVAKAMLGLRFDAAAIEQINQLAEKNRLGKISDDERAVLDRYVRVGNFLNLIHAKAQISLSGSSHS